MDFREEYKQKLVSADEAVKLIKSGDWVDYGWCTNTVDALDQALAKRTDELTDVKLRGGILMKPLAVFAREDAGEHFCMELLAYVRYRAQDDKQRRGLLLSDPLLRTAALLPRA